MKLLKRLLNLFLLYGFIGIAVMSGMRAVEHFYPRQLGIILVCEVGVNHSECRKLSDLINSGEENER